MTYYIPSFESIFSKKTKLLKVFLADQFPYIKSAPPEQCRCCVGNLFLMLLGFGFGFVSILAKNKIDFSLLLRISLLAYVV